MQHRHAVLEQQGTQLQQNAKRLQVRPRVVRLARVDRLNVLAATSGTAGPATLRGDAIMPEVTLNEIPRKLRELVDKASAAMERGNTDYAVEMLLNVLDTEPRLLEARKLLRNAQIARFVAGGGGAARHVIASLTGLGGMISASALVKTKPLKALQIAERLMNKDPLNRPFIKLLASAALAADLPQTAIHALEVAREAYPNDVELLFQLGTLYKDNGITDKARECFEVLYRLRPNDPKILKALKDAQAMDSMQKGRWVEVGEKGDYRKVLRDREEALRLEQAAKAVKTASDIESLIADHLQKIEREPNNVNYRRALADLYARAERYDEALAALQEADRLSGGGDPQIDRAISQIHVRKFDAAIQQARNAGDEARATQLEAEKKEFLFNDAQERVRRYPNDLQFKYELGVLLFERGMFNEAIQQFQQSQRNPQRRTRSLYYLARCFEQKGQLDIAAEQLEKAASELTVLDNTKKDILYELGIVYERMGRGDKAVELFKEIYAVDIAYRDVADRIERYYKSQSSPQAGGASGPA
ncbi:MAG: tetratricopeptide repeat protein [Kiritimatiellae bacterium]|nr:tetratricopeptide repeat protein [Kiritimatiellia bacterium]